MIPATDSNHADSRIMDVCIALLILARSHAPSHVSVINKDQHNADADVYKPHRCQKYRQFSAFRDVERVQRHSRQ